MYLHGADGLTATLELEVAAVAVAVPWGRAPAVLTAVADRFAGSVGGQAVSVEAGALVGRHTASEGAARIALRLAVLAALRLQGIPLAALALVPVIAHPIATAQGAGGDALALGGTNMARDADTGVRSRADSVVAIIGANRLAAAVNVRDRCLKPEHLSQQLYTSEKRKHFNRQLAYEFNALIGRLFDF